MATWRSRRTRRRNWRRPVDRRAQAVILGIAGLLAAFAYFKGHDRTVPSEIAGAAHVTEGDSISIGGMRIRLRGIDAPELDQTCADANGANWQCGERAARELSALIRGLSVTCRTAGLDPYERVLAVCSLPDGSNVNASLVRNGWAIALSRPGPYSSAEADAKAAKRGIWQGAFVRPSEWRNRRE